MLGILFILILAAYLVFLYPIFGRKTAAKLTDNPKYNDQLKKLWAIAQTSMKEKKTLRAEKALLTILKFDDRNAAAYNRLGILYAKEQNFDEAIECFEIAQSLDNNASSLHNVGLIYLETGAYEKAAMAFSQALKTENNVPARYLALAKAQEKMGQKKLAVESLEAAFALDDSTSTLRQILAIYEDAGDAENVALTTARIEKKLAEEAAKRETKRRLLHRKASKSAKIVYPKARPKATKTRAASTSSTTSPRPRTKLRPGRSSNRPATPKPAASTTKSISIKPVVKSTTKSAAKPRRKII